MRIPSASAPLHRPWICVIEHRVALLPPTCRAERLPRGEAPTVTPRRRNGARRRQLVDTSRVTFFETRSARRSAPRYVIVS
jgi:hypothetical protein